MFVWLAFALREMILDSGGLTPCPMPYYNLKDSRDCALESSSFYRSTMESILTLYRKMVLWVLPHQEDRKAHQRIIKMLKRITGTQLSRLENIKRTNITRRVSAITKESTQPGHCLLTLCHLQGTLTLYSCAIRPKVAIVLPIMFKIGLYSSSTCLRNFYALFYHSYAVYQRVKSRDVWMPLLHDYSSDDDD